MAYALVIGKTMNEMEKFLHIQEQQLKRWESILKKSVMKDLRAWVVVQNSKVVHSTDIPRGVDLQMYIHNNLMK